MTRKEIEEYRRRLTKILRETDIEGRWKELKELAKEVGASIYRIFPFKDSDITSPAPDGTKMNVMAAREAHEAEIVHNIEQTLQTWTMIDMCRTATRNWWIAVGACVVSLLSMVAAWMAVIRAE